MSHGCKAAEVLRERADNEHRQRINRRFDRSGERRKEQGERGNDEELKNDEINSDQYVSFGSSEMMSKKQQSRVKAQSHEKRVDDEGTSESEILTGNKLPAAHGAREHGIQCLLVDLLRDQANADKDSNHNAEQRDCSQS